MSSRPSEVDQILYPYYRCDGLSAAEAQEIIECLWVKLDERVMLDNRHFEDRFSSADGPRYWAPAARAILTKGRFSLISGCSRSRSEAC